MDWLIYGGDSRFKLLTKIDDFYFSNVQQVNIYLDDYSQARQLYSDVIKILINFKNLKTLLIYTNLVGL
jgi:DNA-directed RNA polymerase alpha subunit